MSPDPRLEVVHIDDAVIVVDKPAGLVVHPAPSHRGDTLAELLTDVAGGGVAERAGIVHRLDKDTSGLMVVARGAEAHRDLSAQIRERRARREYTALVEGRLASRTGMIDAPIGRHRRRRTEMAVRGSGSRAARTHFEVIEQLPADTLVAAKLETGRTHQIRAHFAAIGHPVAGDPRYGHSGRHGLERQFLHSTRLSFRHPETDAEMTFTSDLPADLAAALNAARRA
jgi:23S rRNA pseudouridine1911/1915/1917 synthase